MLSKEKLGLNIIEPSTKFVQCQTVLRKKLKDSPNEDIRQIHQLTSSGMNVQYDSFKNTREITKQIRDEKKVHIEQPSLQGANIQSIWNQSLEKVRKMWPTIQARLPKNIYHFTVRYMNNTLPNKSNLKLWGLTGDD